MNNSNFKIGHACSSVVFKQAFAWAGCLIGWCGVFCLDTAQAQLPLGNRRNDNQAVFALAPRAATRPMKLAEKAIQDGDFQQATALLGELLAEPMLNEYLIPEPNPRRTEISAISLRKKAEQLLGQIPIDQRGTYQEKYGVKAKVMLQKAIAANDTQAIAMTGRLYFHTDAGLEATMLVGHEHLAQGRPVMAAVAFEKVAKQSQGSKRFDPEATLLAAVSWSLSGAADRSEKLLRALKQNQGDAEARFYGKTVALFDENTPLQKWLKDVVAATPLESHAIVNQWLVFRGDSRRNAQSGSGFPLLSPRWSIRTIVDPVDEAAMGDFQQNLIQAKVSPLPKVHPLAVGNTLVMRTDDRLYGVDADSGKRLWSYPPANVFRSGEQKSQDALGRLSNRLHQDKLRERLWLDALYGQISSDGNSVFLIPNPGIATDREDWRSYQSQVYDEPTDLRLYNELKSLDLKQQGALKWQVGSESGLDEPELAKSFFLGPPLPVGDRLYAICVQQQSVRLVVLDAETGRFQWGRHLASTEESVSFRHERLRRLAGATPSESDGVLICPTGLNAIVAVDLATRSLSWGFQFKQPARSRINPLTVELNKWNSMWRDATVTLTGGAVIYTPIDSNEIYCLNLQTGESLWKDFRKGRTRQRLRFMHVETVRDGNIIITSAGGLKAIDLKTGTEIWETRLTDYGLVSGRGYVSGSHCFIPTTSKKVLRISTATGEVDGVAMTEKVLGNLISFRGDVISHGIDHVTAYPRDEPSRLMLTQAPDTPPTDTQPNTTTPNTTPMDDHPRLAIKAQLHLLDGQYQQSVDAISQAYDLFPNSNYAQVLVQALTRLIDVDFERAEQISQRYQNLFEKQDLHRLLRGKVTGLLRLDRWDEAFETLLQIAQTIELQSPAGKSAGQRIDAVDSIVFEAAAVDNVQSSAKNPANEELTMLLKQWLRWKLNEVYHACDAQTKTAYRKAVTKHLQSFQGDSLTQRHDRICLFPVESLDENIYFKTATELLTQGHYVRAGSLLNGLNPDVDDAGTDAQTPTTQTAHGILPRAQLLLQRMVAADANLDAIAELEATIEELKTVQSPERSILAPALYKAIKPISGPAKIGRILRTDEINVDWHHDVTRLEQEKLNNYFINTQHFCDVVAADQPEIKTLGFRYSDEFREFRLYDRLGRFVNKIYLDPNGNFQGTTLGSKGRIFLHNSLLLLCIEKEMFAIDWEKFVRGETALLWFADNVVCSSSGYVSGTMDGIFVLSDGFLKCLNPFTGEVLWQRSNDSSSAALLESDQSLTLWRRAEKSYDRVDPMVGRLMTSGKVNRQWKSGSLALATADLQLFVENKKTEIQPDEDGDQADAILNSMRKGYSTTELNLYDFTRQELIWKKSFPYPTQSTLVDQDSLLLLSKDGVFSMIDLRSGNLKFKTKIPELQKSSATSIVVDQLNGLYVVTVYSSSQQPASITQDDTRVTFHRMHKDNGMISGNIVALDAATGQPVWEHPVPVQRFQMLEGLPWDSPFLFLTRRNVYESDKRSVRIQVAMVDLESGKLKANELFTAVVRDNVYYHVICQPETGGERTQSIELQVASLKAQFYLDDIETAPQPVAALTNDGSFKRMKQTASTPVVPPLLATDFQKLVDQAIADQQRRKELSKEEVRLTELEMKK